MREVAALRKCADQLVHVALSAGRPAQGQCCATTEQLCPVSGLQSCPRLRMASLVRLVLTPRSKEKTDVEPTVNGRDRRPCRLAHVADARTRASGCRGDQKLCRHGVVANLRHPLARE